MKNITKALFVAAPLALVATGAWFMAKPSQNPQSILTKIQTEKILAPLSGEQGKPSAVEALASSKKTPSATLTKSEKNTPEQYAKVWQSANHAFDTYDAPARLSARKTALSKIVTGNGLSIADQVALQKPWERIGAAAPGYQHQQNNTTIDVNGVQVNVDQPGIIVPNVVMLHIPQGQEALLGELAQIAGINNIEPVFKGAKPKQTNGKRDLAGWQRIEVNAPATRIKAIVKALQSFEGVGIAEPVYERSVTAGLVPAANLQDPILNDQWHLDAANVKQAWAYLEQNDLPAGGSESITVAVIDSGVDYTHPDLVANMWVNAQEIPDNGIDDDGNGYIDDIHGASVLGETFSHNGNPKDDHGHGTHVAGIIAATGGNSIGGVGVAYNAKIMAVKAAQYSGVLTTADIAEAIYYAVDNGADIINMSFGGYGRSQVEEDALATAYSQAVLIAAAGNDGKPNQRACRGAPSYPAAHPWVLGVMAHNETPNTKGDYMSGFSNRECIVGNGVEYELMAPGASIWSTLPNEAYAAWSGTSMAAPVVAGMAALARTKWPEKNTYSSRFIMGQVGATGGSLQAYTPLGGLPVSYPQADALNALTSTPKPELSYEEHWLFDETTTAAVNDSDGRIDAGETVELAITIRNRWGKASNVVVTLSTPSGAASADPYVSFQTASVNYGAVGSFNSDDNGLEYNDDLLVTGVANPFVFTVAADTPNNHVIPFTLTMTAENGLDQDDSSAYTFESSFELIVQRGRELPSIIDSDAVGTDGGNLDTDGVEDGIVTLNDSALWIVDKPILVAKGITLKVTEGAQIQFWSSLPDEAYTVWKPSYIQVEGILDTEGTAARPVKLLPSALFPNRSASIKTAGQGSISLTYSDITNLISLKVDSDGNDYYAANYSAVNYNIFRRNDSEQVIYDSGTSPQSLYPYQLPVIPGSDAYGVDNPIDFPATGNRFYRLGSTPQYISEDQKGGFDRGMNMPAGYDMSLIDNSSTRTFGGVKNSVFLKNFQTTEGYEGTLYVSSELENLVTPSDYAAFEPFEYDGKTYAIFYSHAGSTNEKIAAAKAFSSQLNGSLFTVSSEEEILAVSNWLYDVGRQPQSYWEATYDKCEPVNDEDTFCRSTIGQSSAAIGLIKQNDGSYLWDGETPSYDFLATQDSFSSAYSQVNQIAQIYRPSSIIYSVNAGMISYLITQNSNSANLLRFIIELPGSHSQASLDSGIAQIKNTVDSSSFSNNAILNTWHDLNPLHWGTIKAPSGDNTRRWDLEMDISGNFWGGAGDSLVDIAITDFNDDFNLARVKYQPTLTTAPETAYPFVVNAEVLDADGNAPSGSRFGAQISKWRVTFNRDMDTAKSPLVTFGPAEPFTDFSIPGDWVDARTWEGSFEFTPVTGDGFQNIRIVGAVAADNAWLVTGDDSERFRFELITSGLESLSLQASGGRDKVSLNWVQDDFELLHGYNLYRSSSTDGQFERINGSTINKTKNSYEDTDVTPGVAHYYYFTVVSDGGESEPSNTAVATPTDTIAPQISHQAVPFIAQGDNLTIRATVSDNIAVSDVTLFYRNGSTTEWNSRAMVKTDAERYSTTLEAAIMGQGSLAYYIEASDTANTVSTGSESSPYNVLIVLPSNLDADDDGVPNGNDAFPYDASESVDLDGDGVGDNLDEDDDGDGVADSVDRFPRDASEWLDSDGDGTGDNADNDDDNDNVNDDQDRFPLDDRGSKDSDNDGLPDQWELDNGLNPVDATDAMTDTDFDGYTALEEFTRNSSPNTADQKTQIVYTDDMSLIVDADNLLPVYYRASDGATELTGLGIRIHFNSQLISAISIENLLAIDLVAVESAPMLDLANYDNDFSTDSYLSVAWASQSSATWPGQSPIKLFDLSIRLSDQLSATDVVDIRFSNISTDPEYGFSGAPFTSSVGLASLDIDGNGHADALTDGLLILRHLFGFSGEVLTTRVIAADATYTTPVEIEARVQEMGPLLDIDADGNNDALTDGLLILRYLFGFKGDTLVKSVVSPNATRNTIETIEAELSRLTPAS